MTASPAAVLSHLRNQRRNLQRVLVSHKRAIIILSRRECRFLAERRGPAEGRLCGFPSNAPPGHIVV